jgi:outer membrane protein
MIMKGLVAILLILFVQQLSAQTLTLTECVETAVKNNLALQQKELQERESKINWRNAQGNLMPNLNASANSGINTGRSIDPFTNDYVNQQVKFSSYGANSDVVLFNAGSLMNNSKEQRSLYNAAVMDAEQEKQDLTINVILTYLQVLNNEDQLTQANNQAALSKQQVERLQTLNESGAISPYLLHDLRGQYATDQLAVITAQNNLDVSRVQLFRLMNVPYDPAASMQRLDSTELLDPGNRSVESTLKIANGQFPMIKAAEQRIKSGVHGVRSARGQLFPVLGFGGSANTNYSSAAGIKYGKQLDNNVSTSLSLGLNIPIFNGFFARNRIKLAAINLENYKLTANNTRNQLQQAVYEAYINRRAAADKYRIAQQQVEAFLESFRSAEIRFNEGVINSVDYLTARNNLDRARINVINARYEYLLRNRIIDYYEGRQL